MITQIHESYYEEKGMTAVTNGCCCCQKEYDMDADKDMVITHAIQNLEVLLQILDYYHITLDEFMKKV